LQIKHPVWCGYLPAFHFHATLARVLGPTLIRHQVVQVCQPCEKRLLAPFGMMEPVHREQLALESLVGLIEQGAGDRHLRVFEHRIPPCSLLLEAAPDMLPVGHPCAVRHVAGKVA
jgi:hypothetical protein